MTRIHRPERAHTRWSWHVAQRFQELAETLDAGDLVDNAVWRYLERLQDQIAENPELIPVVRKCRVCLGFTEEADKNGHCEDCSGKVDSFSWSEVDRFGFAVTQGLNKDSREQSVRYEPIYPRQSLEQHGPQGRFQIQGQTIGTLTYYRHDHRPQLMLTTSSSLGALKLPDFDDKDFRQLGAESRVQVRRLIRRWLQTFKTQASELANQ